MQIFVARVVDQSDFDRVVAEHAFGTKRAAEDWLNNVAIPAAQSRDPEYANQIIGTVDAIDYTG